MADAISLSSLLADVVVVEALMPYACPSDFGPSARYRLEEAIGAGRDSVVYRAADRELSSEGFEAHVAIKILRGSGLGLREAQAIRRVAHPNVVGVLERGITAEGFAYVVMEHVAGGQLDSLPLPLSSRAGALLFSKLCSAVQAVHAAGLVHCDLKPSNVLLGTDGEPKVVDFELARWLQHAPDQPRGNLAFMSPEQFQGRDDALTPPSDIYALGGLLFYVLTGKLPNGATPEQIAAAHASERPPPASGVSSDIDAIIARAMDRSRERRYNSAGEMADDLRRYLERRPLPWRRASTFRSLALWSRRRPVHAIIAAVGTVAAASSVGLYLAWANVEKARAVQVERDIRIASEARFASTAQKGKNALREMYRNAVAKQAMGTDGIIVTAVLFLNWMSDLYDPILGHKIEVEGRRELLRAICGPLNDPPATFTELLGRFALAYAEVEAGSTEDALAILDDIEPRFHKITAEDDPMRTSLAVIRAGAESNAALPSAQQRGPAIERMTALRATLPIGREFGPSRRLIDNVIRRLNGLPAKIRAESP